MVAALFVLAGCETPAPVTPVPRPPERPAQPVKPVAPKPDVAVDPGPESRELAQYYLRVQNSLLAQGLLRRDGGGIDTPFGQRQLVENFVRVALFEEYASVGNTLVARATASRLHRWEQPVTLQVEFGASVPAAVQTRDRASIAGFGARLSRITGLPIRTVASGGNYNVFVLNEAERRALGPRLRALVPGISDLAVRTVTDMPRSSYCLVFALDSDNSGTYTRAVAVIRAEHPDLLRLSCIHEELTQGLGLSNDSPAARPSIFNDDEEFALLTTHDEMLLKMLYDRRIRPGMSQSEARRVAEIIAAELVGGES